MNAAIEMNGNVYFPHPFYDVQDWEGRPLKISKAMDKPKREFNKDKPKREFNKDKPKREFNDTNKIIVNSLAWKVNTDALREAFSKFGDIEECIVPTDRKTGKSRGMGLVRFSTEESMKKAIEAMNGVVSDL